jgi:hypothetical protein
VLSVWKYGVGVEQIEDIHAHVQPPIIEAKDLRHAEIQLVEPVAVHDTRLDDVDVPRLQTMDSSRFE